jgi:hypothetical protein
MVLAGNALATCGEFSQIQTTISELARRFPTDTVINKVSLPLMQAQSDLQRGKPLESIVPFWRVVEPGSKIARRLSCDDGLIAHWRALEAPRDASERPG